MSGRRTAETEFSHLARIAFFLLSLLFLIVPQAAFSSETVVLGLVVNGQPHGDVFALLAQDGDVLIRREDLSIAKFRPGIGTETSVHGVAHVSLRSIAGLAYGIEPASASLKIQADPKLFETQSLDATFRQTRAVVYPQDNSAFLNYSLSYGTDTGFFNLATELGLRIDKGFFLSTFDYLHEGDRDRFVRLLTTLILDDREGMRTLRAGDVPAFSGPLGTSLPLGGFQISTNFDTRPYFVRFPTLTLTGAVESSSEIEVRVNDQLFSRNEISPGAFVFDNVPPQTGPGEATITIRDAFGRTTVLTEAFYFTDRLLQKGLHEYSYSLGFLRKNLGATSFDYDQPAFLAFHNYGLSKTLKAGYSLELSEKVLNAGATTSFLAGRAGVIELGLNASHANDDVGLATLLGYIYQSRPFSTSLSLSYLTPEYRNVSLDPTVERPSVIRTSVGFSRRRLGSIGFEYGTSRGDHFPDSTIYGVSYNKTFRGWANLFLRASRTESENAETDDRITANLNLHFMRDLTATLGTEHSSSFGSEYRASLQKNRPQGTGTGFRAEVRRRDDRTDAYGNIEYQNRYGRYRAEYTKADDLENVVLTAAGGVGYIDRSVFLSRPISDAFVKVETGDVPDVRVYYYGNESGRTNRKGWFVIPDVRSFQDNRISVEPADVPINYAIGKSTRYIAPAFRSGGVLEFGLVRTQGFTGRIFVGDAEGKNPAEFAVIRIPLPDGQVLEGLVGRRGDFYFENVPPGRYRAELRHEWQALPFELLIPESEEVIVDLGEIMVTGKIREPAQPAPAPKPPDRADRETPARILVRETPTAPECGYRTENAYVGWTEPLCFQPESGRLTPESAAALSRFTRVLGYNTLPVAEIWAFSDPAIRGPKTLTGDERLFVVQSALAEQGILPEKQVAVSVGPECRTVFPKEAKACFGMEQSVVLRLVIPETVKDQP